MESIDPKLLLRQHRSVPRYTSYPTAPAWQPLTASAYIPHVQALSSPISLYVHIPFCHSMCLYCACNVVLNRKPENEERYIQALQKEILQLTRYCPHRIPVSHIHLGGGTPTQLSIPLLERLMQSIHTHFDCSALKECAIEVDPRTVVIDHGAKMRALRSLGFDRISLGVQDTNPTVQAAVRRHQTREMTEWTLQYARRLGFVSINLDFIYGLPYQTKKSFAQTIQEALMWSPDRIALFSYAHLPQLKLHQRAIKPHTLPSIEEKFALYAHARAALIQGGYQAIGMDHFAKKDDPISLAYEKKTLYRNFQGYTIAHTPNLLGIGSSAISMLESCYAQNTKELSTYYAAIAEGSLPIVRGCLLSDEDKLRRWVIQSLMCRFEIHKEAFYHQFDIPFEVHFASLHSRIQHLVDERLIEDQSDRICATPLGELFIRNVASLFDKYLHAENHFSSSI